MKFQTSVSVLAILAISQLVYAQEAQQEQAGTAAAEAIDNNTPVLETAIPDIYWWKSILKDDEISRYLTEPAQTAAGATDAATVPTPVAATSTPDSPASGISPSNSVSDAASASSAATDATSAAGISAAVTDAASTGAVSAGSSSFSAGSPAVATSAISQSIAVPKPSGGSIPPATTSNAVNHTSKATQTNIEMSRVVLSAIAVSAALFKFFN